MTKLTPEGQAAERAHDSGLGPEEYWNAIAQAAIEASEEVKRLRAAVETALSDLECAHLCFCWCFTRAAMRRPACDCATCEVWRVLSEAVPQ